MSLLVSTLIVEFTKSFVQGGLELYSLNHITAFNNANVHRHFKRVYFTLFMGNLFMIAGACMNFFVRFESGWLMNLGLVGSSCFVYQTDPNSWKVARGIFTIFGAWCFGVCVLPLIEVLLHMDPRFIVAFLVGRAICFGCFLIETFQARPTFRQGFLSSCVLLVAWLFIACHFLDSRFLLFMEFILLLYFPIELMVYNNEIAGDVIFRGHVDYVKDVISLTFC